MLERLAWGLVNFIWYLAPLYVFMLNSLNQKFKWHNSLDRIFSKFTVTAVVPLVFFLFVILNVWENSSMIFYLFYLFFFFQIFYYLCDQISTFQSFVISTLCIFAISEIWEIPVKLNSLISLQGGQGFWNILIISAFKMVSIPMLIYLAKVWKWNVTQNQKDILMISGGIVAVLLIGRIGYSVSFLYGIFLRIVVAIVTAFSVIGFRKQDVKGT